MTEVIELERAKLDMAVRRGYRNWKSQFQRISVRTPPFRHLHQNPLPCLLTAKTRAPFYLFDLVMNLRSLGSGFEFTELDPKEKMAVMDQYLFLLDRIRFEFMKRLGWLEAYPGERMHAGGVGAAIRSKWLRGCRRVYLSSAETIRPTRNTER